MRFRVYKEAEGAREAVLEEDQVVVLHYLPPVGGGVRIHPENARKSGRHGVQCVAQCVACAALTLDVWQ